MLEKKNAGYGKHLQATQWQWIWREIVHGCQDGQWRSEELEVDILLECYPESVSQLQRESSDFLVEEPGSRRLHR